MDFSALSAFSGTGQHRPRASMLRARFGLGLALCLLLCLLLAACGQDSPATAQKDVIKIAYLPITHALPVLMQHETSGQGDDTLPTVELVRYGSWPELMDALNTGRVDGASVLCVLAMKAREQGLGLRGAMLAHRGGNVVVVAPGITGAQDLKGRTVAIPHRQSSHYLIVRQLIRTAGLTMDDVKVIELTPGEMPAALAQGTIDAYCVAEPFGARSVAMGTGKILTHADELWPQAVCCALVFSEAFLRDHLPQAQAYAASYAQAAKNLAAQPETARRLAAKALKVDGEALELSLGWIQFTELTLHEADYVELVSRMREAGLTADPPPYEVFVDSRLTSPGGIPAAKP